MVDEHDQRLRAVVGLARRSGMVGTSTQRISVQLANLLLRWCCNTRDVHLLRAMPRRLVDDRARFLTCPKNAPFRDVTPEVCMGARTPPKLNIPKRCRGKRFSRSECPKRAVTGNGRARDRACGARAPRGATSKPLRNPHVAPPTTLPDVTGASRGPSVRMTRYGMASGGR